jgi:clan AA aspartic protease
MISGPVNAKTEATVRLVVRDANGQAHAIEFVIDTGFSGDLTLPLALVTTLGLVWLGRQWAVLADGSSHTFDNYEAIIEWDERPRTLRVLATDAVPLLGMNALAG